MAEQATNFGVRRISEKGNCLLHNAILRSLTKWEMHVVEPSNQVPLFHIEFNCTNIDGSTI